MNARRLTLTIVVWACSLAGVLAFAGASANAETLHKYEPPSITGVSSGSGASLTGPFQGLSGMTVYEGDLYTVEKNNEAAESQTIVNEFSSSSPYGFVSQLPQPSLSGLGFAQSGIALSASTGEREMYIGKNGSSQNKSGEEIPTGVAVFGVCPSGLECASFQSEWTGAHTPEGSFEEVRDLAVDNSTSLEDWAQGDVFVLDNRGSEHSAIDVFKPDAGGKEPSKVEAQITGPSPSAPSGFMEQVAVSGFNGDVVVHADGVDLFKPVKPAKAGEKGTYSFVGELSPPSGALPPSAEIQNLAVDSSNGEIYVATSIAVFEFSAEGAYIGEFTGEEAPEKAWSYATHRPTSIAVEPVSHRLLVSVQDNNEGERGSILEVFGPDVVIPDVSSSTASLEVERATHSWGAELAGTVAPDGGEATCWFVWGASPSLGHVEPCAGAGENSGDPIPSGGGSTEASVAVHAHLSDLSPDTTYYYRLQAENPNGTNRGLESQDQHFTTQGPGLVGESVSEVSSSSVRLEATINPHEKQTSYRLEYDTSPYAQGESSHGTSVPAESFPVGSGTENTEIGQHVEGLSADTEYHYRVVATSELQPGVFEEFDSPDQTFLTQRSHSPLALPDGRQWELVSPVEKRGGRILPIGDEGPSQASVGGEAFTYVTSAAPELEPQGYTVLSQELSTRGAGGWSSADISMPHTAPAGITAGKGGEYRFVSEDLSVGVTELFGTFSDPEATIAGERVVEASPKATERTPFVRHNSTCKATPSTCYESLLTSAAGEEDVLPGTKFGESGVSFVDATPDGSHVMLAWKGLSEWSAEKPATERLQQVSSDPGAVLGSRAGSGALSVRHAVSDDGTRVFFSASENLYMRDTVRGETVYLGHGSFQTASANGSKAFFIVGATSGGDLYECEIVEVQEAGGSKLKCDLSDLTPPAGARGAEEQAGVQSVLGASEDSSYVYFAADGVQAAGATPGVGDCGLESAIPAAEARCNLYVNHDGKTSFIATLSGEDAKDWAAEELLKMASRVSPNGEWLAFMSNRSLTGYDNLDAVSGKPDEEVYLYNAAANKGAGKLVCASCDPTGARPVGVEGQKLYGGLADGYTVWGGHLWLAAEVPGWSPYNLSESVYQSRYLSNEGRLFFNSTDALVPQDTNGEEDVYEYDPVGVGGPDVCSASSPTFSGRSDGCVGLISSGAAAGESVFLDASGTGDDVFFLTYGKLVSTDVDTSLDVYDAHECTTGSPCQPVSEPEPPECKSAGACRAAPAPQPSIYGAPASATFVGAGDVIPSPVTKSVVRAKALTRAQKLAKALRACGKDNPKKKRAVCERQARKRYGSAKSSKASAKSRKAQAKKGAR